MGSMWCKPSQFTDDCSPKLNIQSILTRLSSQICPSRCRYSHSGSRSHTKQRPRNEAVSKGCRPVISHPLMQPVPPPRKKRKHIQDLSRSEEHLCSSDIPTSTPLRAANSLPVLCVPISQLKTKHNQEPLESITEEAMPSIMREMEDMESLPISEVYFLRKDGNTSAPVFDAIPKDVADKTMTLEISGITNMANSNFLDRSNTCGQVRIDTEVIERITDKRKEIIETETITRVIDKKSVAGSNSSVGDHIQRSEKTRIIEKKGDGTNLIAGDNIQRSEPKQRNDDVGGNVVTVNNVVTKTDDVNSCDEVSNDGVDSVDTLEGKKRQDAMKSKWLQNILIGSDATENHRGDNSIPSFIPKDLREGVKNEQNASQNLNEAQEIQNANNSKLVEGPDDRVSKLIVTPECLNETLQRLNTSKANRDEVLNSRNLVFNSQNSNLKVNESLTTMGKESNSSNWLTVEGQNVDKNDSSKNSDISSSRKSSRRSSITDSLQEFESSIYEMLQESAKANASDEDDSFIALHKQTLDSRQGTL